MLTVVSFRVKAGGGENEMKWPAYLWYLAVSICVQLMKHLRCTLNGQLPSELKKKKLAIDEKQRIEYIQFYQLISLHELKFN